MSPKPYEHANNMNDMWAAVVEGLCSPIKKTGRSAIIHVRNFSGSLKGEGMDPNLRRCIALPRNLGRTRNKERSGRRECEKRRAHATGTLE